MFIGKITHKIYGVRLLIELLVAIIVYMSVRKSLCDSINNIIMLEITAGTIGISAMLIISMLIGLAIQKCSGSRHSPH